MRVFKILAFANLCSVVFLIGLRPNVYATEIIKKSWFDRSHSIFFPVELKDKLNIPQFYPLFWWNFIVIESSDLEVSRKACAHLKTQLSSALSQVECEQSLSDVASLVSEWSEDVYFRAPEPGIFELKKAFSSALTKASLPFNDPALLKLLRSDPLNSWRDLLAMAESRIKLTFARKNGFFIDKSTSRIILPIQMSFAPNETQKTEKFYLQLSEKFNEAPMGVGWDFLGPHASTLKNEKQISNDMSVVSTVGTSLLVLFGLGLFFTGRWRLIFLVPPVLAAVGVGALVTIVIFGSIHGLTFAFGSGIIGLALDYGLHAVFNKRSGRVWRSNMAGLLTTLIGLGVLMWSSIPLLRQMMVFSIVGISTAYIFFQYLLNRYPKVFLAAPFLEVPEVHNIKTGIVCLIMFAALIGAFKLRPNLDMRQFDFQDLKAKKISAWFFENQLSTPPLFRVHDQATVLNKSHLEKYWADQNKIKIETLANYMPPTDVQESNFDTWIEGPCKKWKILQSDSEFSEHNLKFFRPFLEALNQRICVRLGDRAPRVISMGRTYFKHLKSQFQGSQEWITLFLPASRTEEALILGQFPDSRSMKSIISIFPETFARELAWMVPLSLTLATGLLFYYYKKWGPTFMALVPFFTGMGFVVIAKFIFGFEVSFISVMALIMVFGFSIDYGIFVNDILPGSDPESVKGVWTGLGCSALVTIAGFIPMVFCRHPVLNHLGMTLFFGTLGTYLGTVWGIPGLKKLSRFQDG